MGVRSAWSEIRNVASLRRLERYIGADVRKLHLYASIYVVATVVVSFVPYVCGKFLNEIINLEFYPDSDKDPQFTFMLLVAVIVMLAIWATASAFSARKATLFSLSITRRLRRDLNLKMMRVPVSRLDTMSDGEFTPMISTWIPSIGRMLSTDYIGFFAWGTMIAIVGVMMLVTSPLLFLTYLIVLPVSALASKRITRMSTKDFRLQLDLMEGLNTKMSDIVSGHRTMKTERLEESVVKDFEDANAEFTKAFIRSRTRSGAIGPLTWMMVNLGYVFTVLNGTVMMARGTLDPGMFLSFMVYVRMINKPMLGLSAMYDSLRTDVDSMKRILDFLGSEEAPSHEDFQVEGGRGRLEFRDVTFGYTEGKPVIRSLSFNAEPGSVTAIAGRTGSGKSTLTSLIMGFYHPWSGKVLIDGCDVGEMSAGMISSRVAIVLQDPWIFEGTVRENVVYNREISQERLDEVASMTGLSSFIESLPDGYDTRVGNDVMRISLAHRRMISLTRALLGDPEIVILDEAFAGMDPGTGSKALGGLRKAMAGRTVIMTAHDKAVIDSADAVVRLRGLGSPPARRLRSSSKALLRRRSVPGRFRWPRYSPRLPACCP